MPKGIFFDSTGKKGDVELSDELFGAKVNVGVMHEVVRAQRAAARSGTASTKTRAEVRGGGRKPWRQKGTGRARHGSIREPQWTGGGIAHGPKPRDFSFRVNRKVKAAALRSALSDRANEDKIIVVEFPEFDEPETAKAVELLSNWKLEGRTLLVIDPTKESSEINAWKSFRNLPLVDIVSTPTTYMVLRSDQVVFTRSALDRLVFGPSKDKGSSTSDGEGKEGQGSDASESETPEAQEGDAA